MTAIRLGRVSGLLLIWIGCVMVGRVGAAKPGIFVETGDLATARFSHTATLLPNGKVLVAGGQGSTLTYLSSAEMFNPATGQVARHVAFVTRVDAAGERLSGAELGTCADGIGSVTSVAGTVGLAYEFETAKP